MGSIPFRMLDLAGSASDARRMDRMEGIYHAGQRLAWDGRKVLDELADRHGGVRIPPAQRDALGRVYANIMWGELAAWKISAQLADRIEPLGAKMAATSQAHDEARHFYVMHDYLALALGAAPRTMGPASERLLAAVLETDDLACKLLGMQLQVETTALTIFQATREARVCPVLSDLLLYFEKDEARHVGLGLQYLPMLVRAMDRVERARFTAFAVKVVYLLLATNRSMAADLRALGMDPYAILQLARSKQQLVFDELWATAPGSRSGAAVALSNFMQAVGTAMWPPPDRRGVVGRARVFAAALRDGVARVQTSIQPEAG
jgi:hypothetical protein